MTRKLHIVGRKMPPRKFSWGGGVKDITQWIEYIQREVGIVKGQSFFKRSPKRKTGKMEYRKRRKSRRGGRRDYKVRKRWREGMKWRGGRTGGETG